MDVNTYLTNLSKSLIVDSQEKEKIEISFEFIKQKIWGHFQDRLKKVELFGSFDRGTLLPRKIDESSDVDMLVLFKSGNLEPQTFLNQLKEFALKNYKQTEIFQDHPTIVLEMKHIRVELVPGYIEEFTFSSDELKIPAPKTKDIKWITTDPENFKNKLFNKDSQENKMILPLIRMYKYWNLISGSPFTQFSLEDFILSRSYSSCNSLKDYFYEIISDLSSDNETDLANKKVLELKAVKKKLITLEHGDMENYAETEIKQLLPPIN